MAGFDPHLVLKELTFGCEEVLRHLREKWGFTIPFFLRGWFDADPVLFFLGFNGFGPYLSNVRFRSELFCFGFSGEFGLEVVECLSNLR